MGLTEVATAIIYCYLYKTVNGHMGVVSTFTNWYSSIMNLHFAVALTEVEADSIFCYLNKTVNGDMGVV